MRGIAFAGSAGLMIDRVVAALLRAKIELLAIVGMLQELAEVADRGVRRFIDADERDLPA